MARNIKIPDELYARLEALAHPFEDREPADVIQRLIDSQAPNENSGISPLPSARRAAPKGDVSTREVNGRAPRERGATVKLNDHVVHAESVRDLYEQTLHYLSSNGGWDRVVQLAPYKTSARRYLISRDPTHPSGNPFVIPVKHRGLYMEAHKNYQTAISQLARLLSKCGVDFAYVGV